MSSKKICTNCGKNQTLDKFRSRKKKGEEGYYTIGRCRDCEKQDRANYYWDNVDMMRARGRENIRRNGHRYKSVQKKYRQENYPKIKAYMTKYRKENSEYLSEMHKPRAKAWFKKQREELSDSYVIGHIIQRTTLTREDIEKHPELIEVVRKNKLLKRKINERTIST